MFEEQNFAPGWFDIICCFMTRKASSAMTFGLVYFDASHMSVQYSRLLAPVMGALADRALSTADTLRQFTGQIAAAAA